jgi:hypothetical protein
MIGGYDARAAFGFEPSRVDGLHDAPGATLTLQEVPGRAGALRLASPQVGPRQVTIAGTIQGATKQQARDYRDAMLTVLAREQVPIRTGDDLTRELRVDVTGVESSPFGPQFLSRAIRLSITATAAEPFWRDVTETVVSSITATPAGCPCGSAPVGPRLTISGVGSVVRVTLRDALGAVVTQLQLAGLMPGVPVVIDCEAQTIRQGGISQIGALLAGDFPILDARAHGDPVAEAWPTLEVSQGTMVAAYARRWA